MADTREAPEGVGPHEGRELQLMLSGKKPLAMFADAVGSTCLPPEADFAPHVAKGTFVRREEIYRSTDTDVALRCVYFARREEGWRVEALHRIQERLHVFREPSSPDTEREIGRLLGYSDAEIHQFLEWTESRRTSRNPPAFTPG